MNKKGLGKGLGALIKDEIKKDETKCIDRIIEVDTDKIQANGGQPRKIFNEETIDELALSIKNVGIISPIIVKEKGGFYEIVSGERRFRAIKKLKMKKIPIIIRDYDTLKTLEVALIENIQRENLNVIEEAMIYKDFKEKFGLNQEEIAEKVGKNRTTIANVMRLLKLDGRVKNILGELKLSPGHARALLSIEDKDLQFEVAEQIIEDDLSVRQVEELVKEMMDSKETEKNYSKPNDELKEYIYTDISNQLREILGTKVKIKNKKDKGKIEIEYYSQNELDRLVQLFKKI